MDINFATGDVSVNGEVLNEPYIAERTNRAGDIEFPITLEENQIFVMGDNRNYSEDSRNSDIGCLDRRDILGKAIFRLSPFDKMGRIQ